MQIQGQPNTTLSPTARFNKPLPRLVMAIAAMVATAGCAQAGQAQEHEQSSRGAPMAELCLASSAHQQGVDTTTQAQALARIQAELALTDEHRARGLMHREHLGEHEGMLFYYPNSQYRSFWMFNTLIPLDIAYLADDGEILQIKTMEPCLSDNPGRCPGYQSDGRARAALELNAGAFADFGVDVGDYVLDASCEHSPWAAGW